MKQTGQDILDSLDQTQRRTVIESIEAGMGRDKASDLLSKMLGVPVSTRQAAKVCKEVRGNNGGGKSLIISGETGEANSGWMSITDEQVTDEWLISRAWLLDPDEWEIVPGTLKVSFLGSISATKHRRNYRASVRRIRSAMKDKELAELISARKPISATKQPVIDGSLVVCLADMQAGKKESGGSLALQVRFDQVLDNLAKYLDDLAKLERLPSRAVLLGLGDLVESCVVPGMGMSNSPFTCDINQRQQMRLATRLTDSLLDYLSQRFTEVLVAAIPGNHGERRGNGGRGYTTPGDNYDVEIFDNLRFAYEKNPGRYSHVSWQIPADEMSIVVETSGTHIGIAHGHQMGSGATAEIKALSWWKNRCFSRYGDFDMVDVLVTGHYHHHRYADLGRGRVWMQAPAMEGSASSEWFAERGGPTGSTQGLLVFTTANGRVYDNHIIPAEYS